MNRPLDIDLIKTVIQRMLGGSAEPVGDTNLDDIKEDRQISEEAIIYWLLEDLYKCYNKRDVPWGSGKEAGASAKEFFEETRDMLDDWLSEDEEDEEEDMVSLSDSE